MCVCVCVYMFVRERERERESERERERVRVCMHLCMYGPLQMAEQKQDDQLEPTYISSLRKRGVPRRTCRKMRRVRVRDTLADGMTR